MKAYGKTRARISGKSGVGMHLWARYLHLYREVDLDGDVTADGMDATESGPPPRYLAYLTVEAAKAKIMTSGRKRRATPGCGNIGLGCLKRSDSQRCHPPTISREEITGVSLGQPCALLCFFVSDRGQALSCIGQTSIHQHPLKPTQHPLT